MTTEPQPSTTVGRKRHFVLYEPPMAFATACDRTVRAGVEVTTNKALVTCRKCASLAEELTRPGPRVLPPSDEVPF